MYIIPILSLVARWLGGYGYWMCGILLMKIINMPNMKNYLVFLSSI